MAESIREILNDPEKLRAATKAAFDHFDVNQSGSIDRSELRNVLDDIARGLELPPLSEEEIVEAMNKLDTDASGTIEIGEFEVFVKKLLEAEASSAEASSA